MCEECKPRPVSENTRYYSADVWRAVYRSGALDSTYLLAILQPPDLRRGLWFWIDELKT